MGINGIEIFFFRKRENNKSVCIVCTISVLYSDTSFDMNTITFSPLSKCKRVKSEINKSRDAYRTLTPEFFRRRPKILTVNFHPLYYGGKFIS